MSYLSQCLLYFSLTHTHILASKTVKTVHPTVTKKKERKEKVTDVTK